MAPLGSAVPNPCDDDYQRNGGVGARPPAALTSQKLD
jgi:hypothetical protein